MTLKLGANRGATTTRHRVAVCAVGWLVVLLQQQAIPFSQALPQGTTGTTSSSSSCFQTFTLFDPCTERPPRPAIHENGIRGGTIIHWMHQSSGQCFDLYVTSKGRYIFEGLRFFGCEQLFGVNKYCRGPCPGPAGVNACSNRNLDSFACTDDYEEVEQDGSTNGVTTTRPLAKIELDSNCHGAEDGTPTTFENAYRGGCHDGICADGILSLPGVTCARLEEQTGPPNYYCINQKCPRRVNARGLIRNNSSGDELSTTTTTTTTTSTVAPHPVEVEQGSSTYKHYANKCRQVEYDAFLWVKDGHFRAIASPTTNNNNHHSSSNDDNNNKVRENALEAGRCPTLQTQAEYQDTDSHYIKALAVVVPTGEDSQHQQQQDQDMYYIGTFVLHELQRAFESVDPTTQLNNNNKAYDIITNNCAEFMLSLASALDVQVDTKMTAYVTRRLVQDAGQILGHKIRNSIHYKSHFIGGSHGDDDKTHPDKLGRHDYHGHLRALNDEEHHQMEDNDEQVIEALVRARVASHNA